MAETAPTLDPSVRATLEKLADVATPLPVSYVPQTWGWVALALVILALAAWGLAHWLHRRDANRYRAEALAELGKIERRVGDGDAAAFAALPSLLKRVALASWPRARVASLSQGSWVRFLGDTERGGAAMPEPLADLLITGEYRSLTKLAPAEADACLRAARHWIEAHDVSA
jgi:hypothetical protein